MLALSIQKLIFFVCAQYEYVYCASYYTELPVRCFTLSTPLGHMTVFFFAGEGEGGRENHLNTTHLLTEDIKQE